MTIPLPLYKGGSESPQKVERYADTVIQLMTHISRNPCPAAYWIYFYVERKSYVRHIIDAPLL